MALACRFRNVTWGQTVGLHTVELSALAKHEEESRQMSVGL